MQLSQYARDRPIVFVGHSLGALIIKQALTDFEDVVRSRLPVRAILFFGVDWEPRPGLGVAQDLARRFKRITRDHTIKIHTFYEQRSTPVVENVDGVWKRGCKRELMVTKESAVIGCDSEICIPVHASHSQMAKIRRGQGGAYGHVLVAIQEALQSAPEVWTGPQARRATVSHSSGYFDSAEHDKQPSKSPGIGRRGSRRLRRSEREPRTMHDARESPSIPEIREQVIEEADGQPDLGNGDRRGLHRTTSHNNLAQYGPFESWKRDPNPSKSDFTDERSTPPRHHRHVLNEWHIPREESLNQVQDSYWPKSEKVYPMQYSFSSMALSDEAAETTRLGRRGATPEGNWPDTQGLPVSPYHQSSPHHSRLTSLRSGGIPSIGGSPPAQKIYGSWTAGLNANTGSNHPYATSIFHWENSRDIPPSLIHEKMEELISALRKAGTADELLEAAALTFQLLNLFESEYGPGSLESFKYLKLQANIWTERADTSAAGEQFRMIVERASHAFGSESEIALQSNLDLLEFLSGSRDELAARCQVLLAKCLSNSAKWSEAKNTLQRSLKTLESMFGCKACFYLETQEKYDESISILYEILGQIKGCKFSDLEKYEMTEYEINCSIGQQLSQVDGRLEEAEDILYKALHDENYDIMETDYARLGILHSLGQVYHKLDKLDDAEQMLKRAKELCENSGEELSQGGVLSNLADVYFLQLETQKALMTFKNALAAFESEEDIGGISYATTSIAMIYEARGELNNAEDLLQPLLERQQCEWKLDEESLQETAKQLIAVLDALGKDDRAQEIRSKFNLEPDTQQNLTEDDEDGNAGQVDGDNGQESEEMESTSDDDCDDDSADLNSSCDESLPESDADSTRSKWGSTG
ncbi:hypothetical protein DL768_001417 [Monosporascus sp. mg162]|nr:hypothetical protein DL768_001417 [Monosporascus sp. mg162]